MDSTTSFLILLGVIAANQLVLRLAALRGSAWAFWGLQIINLGLSTWIFAFGLPGFEVYPWISWAIGLIFTLRVIQNNALRTKYLREDAKKHRDSRKQEVDGLLERFKDADDEEVASDP